jgi:uncharacterized protein (DUF2147 family)
MSRAARVLAIAAVVAFAAGRAAAADPVMGEWLNADGEGKVRIEPCRDAPAKACGVITWLKTPRQETGGVVRDLHNPDPGLRNRPVIGILVIRGMKPAGPGRWSGGRLYDPETGGSYRGRLTAAGGVLKVEGCLLVVCRTQTWTRAD